jgi:hypothetical protein
MFGEKDYKLTTKSGESIHKVKAESITHAIEIFAEMKKITVINLLKIYKVIEA